MKYRAEFKSFPESESTWSGIFFYRPENEEEEALGTSYAVVKISTPVADFQLDRLAKYIFDEIRDYYYFKEDKKATSTLKQLEESVWKMKAKLETHLAKDEEVMEHGIDIELGLTLIKNNALYGLVIGNTRIFVARGDGIADISEVFEDTQQSGIFKTGSIKLTEDDVIAIASSTSIQNEADEDTIADAMIELNLNALEKVHEAPGSTVLLIADEALKWQELVNREEENVEQEDDKSINTEDTTIEYEPSDSKVSVKEKEEHTELTNEEEELADPIVDENVTEQFEKEVEEELDNERKSFLNNIGSKGKDLMKKSLPLIKNISDKAKEQLDKRIKRTKKSTDIDSEDESISGNDLPQDSSDNIASNKQSSLFNSVKSSAKKIRAKYDSSDTTIVHALKSATKYTQRQSIRFFNWFKTEILGIGASRRVNHKKRLQRNRIILAIAVVVIGVFGYISYQNYQASVEQALLYQDNENAVVGLEDEFSTIQSQIGQSNNISNSIVELASGLESLQARVEVQKNTGLEDFILRLDNLALEIQTTRDNLLNIQRFSTPAIIADLEDIYGEEVDATDLEFTNGSIFITDRGRDVIYKLGTQLNIEPQVFISNVTDPILIAKNENETELVFVDTSSAGAIGRFNSNDATTLIRFPELTPSEIGNIEEFTIFTGNDAMYEIHQSNRQIFKRDRVGEGYGGGGNISISTSSTNWRTDQIFTTAVDIATPRSIYVLSNSAGLTRHTSGGENELNQQSFIGLLPEDYNALRGATALDVQQQFIVIGDSNNSRVLVFEINNDVDETISFRTQYVYEGPNPIFQNIEEVAINTSTNQVYVLDGNKVIRLSL